jgi:hypothetical protein
VLLWGVVTLEKLRGFLDFLSESVHLDSDSLILIRTCTSQNELLGCFACLLVPQRDSQAMATSVISIEERIAY